MREIPVPVVILGAIVLLAWGGRTMNTGPMPFVPDTQQGSLQLPGALGPAGPIDPGSYPYMPSTATAPVMLEPKSFAL
jgi:hypothetical protein